MKTAHAKQIALILYLFIIPYTSWSQCGTDMKAYYPSKVDGIAKGKIKSFVPLSEVKIGIQFHVVLDTTGEPNINEDDIRNTFDLLGAAFAPTGIEFYIKEFSKIEDYNYNNLTTDEDIIDLVNQNSKLRFINVFFVDELKTDTIGLHPGHMKSIWLNPQPESERVDLIFTKTGFTEQEFIHQMGHVFGLFHTNENRWGVELANGTNAAETGDFIGDTPADGVGLDKNKQAFNPHKNNYMCENYNLGCRFTPNQLETIVNTYKRNRTFLY
jgi:hypothetical protein